MSIHPGLVSITFRNFSAREIVDLVRKAGLRGIEWGGDVHAPHGDERAAAEVKKLTTGAGLRVAAYGSYYRAGESEAEGLEFSSVLASAIALDAPTIRIWAGRRASRDADPDYRKQVEDDICRVADLAAAHNITISLEYHGNTLTDTNASAQQILREIDHDNLFTYWQPPVRMDDTERRAGLRAILPRLSNLHVFYWTPTDKGFAKHPLEQGKTAWNAYLEIVNRTGRDHWALLEFVRDDTPEQFLLDAAILKELTA